MARITWTQRQDIGPSARMGASIAFDSERSRTVLFGGRGADGLKGDTWEWEGAHWTQVQDSGPAARENAATADGNAGVILFGGEADTAGGLSRVGDTWAWDGDDWTQLADTGPAPRTRACLVYDSARGNYLLFGGAGANTVFGDTWIFDGVAWTQVADTGPSPRIGHALAYDAIRQRVVLFGGQNIGLANGDTWTWDGADWTHAHDIGPTGRSGHVMAATAEAVWLFGGGPDLDAAALGIFGDTWEWEGSVWTERQDIGPEPRTGASATFDAVRERIVLFGGATIGIAPGSVSPAGDTWEARTSEPDPSPAEPVADIITIDASEAMVTGSDLGFVTVTAAAPVAADRAISVTIGGVPESVVSPPLRMGETTALAFFRMGSHSAGTLIQIAVGASVVHASLKTAVATATSGFHVTPSTIAAPATGGVQAQIKLPGPALPGNSVTVTVMSTTGTVVGTDFVGVAVGQVDVFSLSSIGSLPAGVHQLVAFSRSSRGTSVAGPIDFTVT